MMLAIRRHSPLPRGKPNSALGPNSQTSTACPCVEEMLRCGMESHLNIDMDTLANALTLPVDSTGKEWPCNTPYRSQIHAPHPLALRRQVQVVPRTGTSRPTISHQTSPRRSLYPPLPIPAPVQAQCAVSCRTAHKSARLLLQATFLITVESPSPQLLIGRPSVRTLTQFLG